MLTEIKKRADENWGIFADLETSIRSTGFDSTNYINNSVSCQSSGDSVTFTEVKEIQEKFTPKKVSSKLLADSYYRLYFADPHSLYNKKGDRVFTCGSFLEWAHEVSTFGDINPAGKLIAANFCKDRLCPMCSWRRTHKIFGQASQIMQVIQNDYTFLFLTLTVPNVKSHELNDTISRLMESWHRFSNAKDIKKIMCGYFRALEVTYNKQADSFHPHFHVVIAAPKNYLKSRDYLSRDQFLFYWRRAYRDESITQVDVRVAKSKATKEMQKAQQDLSSIVAEIAKYTVKSSDYLFPEDNRLTDYLVKCFSEALHYRRLVHFGGIFKDVFKELNLDDAESEDADLININGSLDANLAWHIVRYDWGIGSYKFSRTRLEYPEEHSRKRR